MKLIFQTGGVVGFSLWDLNAAAGQWLTKHSIHLSVILLKQRNTRVTSDTTSTSGCTDSAVTQTTWNYTHNANQDD